MSEIADFFVVLTSIQIIFDEYATKIYYLNDHLEDLGLEVLCLPLAKYNH